MSFKHHWRRKLQHVGIAFSPKRFPYPRFALALVVGGIGGWIFFVLNLPLPWMLGSIAACTAAALMRAPIASPPVIRPPMTMVMGVMLGSGFSPEVVSGMLTWLPTLAAMMFYITLAGCLTSLFLRVVGKYDLPTAYCAGMPGGVLEMLLLAEDRKADIRVVALMQSTRILFVTFSLPFLIQFLTGLDRLSRPVMGSSIMDTALTVELAMLATAIGGVVVGRLIRLPVPFLLGPMIASAIIHAFGIAELRPPIEILAGAQIVLGCGIGCRFVNVPLLTVGRTVLISLGSTGILLAVTFTFAFVLSRTTGFDPLVLILAFAPAGIIEMSVVALAIHMDVAFVATHHIFRVFMVTLLARPYLSLLERLPGWNGRRRSP